MKVKPTQKELGRERKIGSKPGPRDMLCQRRLSAGSMTPTLPPATPSTRSLESRPMSLVVKIWTHWNSLENSLALFIKAEHLHLPYDPAITFE